jgi:anti-anti-sigma regulatory factor
MEPRSFAQIRAGEGYTFVRLRGVIDEDNQLSALRAQLSGEVIILDLGEVERINSYGVRDWVNWLNALKAEGRRVVMVRCSTAIIAQANMVTNFCAGALVVSFFAPYYNPAADRGVDKLLSVEEFLGRAPYRAPTFYDEESGDELEFDDFEESYFAFLQGMEGRSVDEHLRALLADASPEMIDRLHAINKGESLSGPVHTANLSRHETPARSEGFPGLMASAKDVARAEARVRVPADAIAPPTAPPRAHSPQRPEATQRVAIQPPPMPSPAASAGLGALLPYLLIVVALVVAAILLYLVLTT